MRASKVVSVVAMSLGAVGLMVSPASASGSIGALGGGAKVTFTSYGETFEVCDTAADGHSAVGRLTYYDDTTSYWNPNGAGTCKTWNLSFPEGSRIAYGACRGEYGSKSIDATSCQWVYNDKA
ncbi:hypothetical protein [Streptomyces megasporus]|uniref:hypothetical protein n=1 Tax=Streptomyces megasporus TaxID=44060 RepID=UPI0012FE9661|nr:hypothetical protein [Streptomyces megasporus]